jgi:hypothetical protein
MWRLLPACLPACLLPGMGWCLGFVCVCARSCQGHSVPRGGSAPQWLPRCAVVVVGKFRDLHEAVWEAPACISVGVRCCLWASRVCARHCSLAAPICCQPMCALGIRATDGEKPKHGVLPASALACNAFAPLHVMGLFLGLSSTAELGSPATELCTMLTQ